MRAVALKEILEALSGAVRATYGSLDREVDHPAPIDEARGPTAITFCSRAGDAAVSLVRSSRAGVVLCAEGTAAAEDAADKTIIVVDQPRLRFLRLVERFFTGTRPRGIHPTAVVEEGAIIAPDAYVGPHCVIGRVQIGEGTVVHAHATILSNTRIGRNVTIHPGVVIGADGFGYARNEHDELEKFPHVGGVVIEDDVEIGANTCIDRGTLGDTIIRQGAKIDNLVHIAHNVVVGRHAAVIAHAMVGGSTRIGDHSWIAPSASVRDGLTIGERAVVGLGAVVVKDVPAGSTVAGSPARPLAEQKRILEGLKRLSAGEGSR